MKIYSVNAGHFKLDGGAMFGVVPKSMWNKLNPADENNMCSWALRCLLIEDGDRLILVDTGMGDKQDAKFFGHYYLHGDDTLDKSLAAHGFSREDITDVFLTHLHFDHCGGALVRQGEGFAPAFPNATYWSNEEHWDWAVQPNDREKASFLKENILPLQESGRLQLLKTPAATDEKLPTLPFADNFSIRFVSGHTEAMMLPQLRYKDRTIVYMADLLPSQAHIPIPYVMAYDTRPLLTLQEKKSFLREAADNNYILFFEHDPVYECCTLQDTEKGVRVGELFKLNEL
ncbi:MBL fold metallo-hydrolase [Terrimonas ferruginea]|uniref:MBL fold metallo-hydrolase n=1 Tax=Terrimonas ferruginea TaxID=249 RepID=UPI000403B6B5|nr:MBL fold metallo-hydrolase [Terrimonas ferruginea]